HANRRRTRGEPACAQRQAACRRADRGRSVSVPARTTSSPAATPPHRVRPSRTTAARPPRHTPPHPHGGARRGSPVAFWILVAVLAAVLLIRIAALSALLCLA